MSMNMRITTLVGSFVTAVLAGSACTVKDINAPSLSGPSTFSQSILMVAERETLTQNGVDSTEIRITSTGPNGESQNVNLRAQIYVDNVAQDFGSLSSKNLVTPATIRYTAPAASPLAAQVSTFVEIGVQSTTAGDVRSERDQTLRLRVIPQGIILPTNPNLIAAFTVTPVAPQVMSSTTFDASTTSNNGAACNSQCTYVWDFGDGTSGNGMTVTHTYRTQGSFITTLTVTDSRGAQSTTSRAVAVQPGAPPTAAFTFSPTPVLVNQAVFFNASGSRPATGRTIVKYEWDFGKGTTGSGVTTSRTYDTVGVYTVTLTLTDDAGTVSTLSQAVAVTAPVVAPKSAFNLTAPLTGQATETAERPATMNGVAAVQ